MACFDCCICWPCFRRKKSGVDPKPDVPKEERPRSVSHSSVHTNKTSKDKPEVLNTAAAHTPPVQLPKESEKKQKAKKKPWWSRWWPSCVHKVHWAARKRDQKMNINQEKKVTDDEKLEDEGGQIVPTLTEEQLDCLGELRSLVAGPSGETANHEQNQGAVEPLNQEEPTRPPVCPPSATVTDRNQQTEEERDGSNALKKMTDEEKLEDEGGQIVPTLTEEQFDCLGLPNFAQTCNMNSGLQSLLILKTFNREIDLQRKVWSSVNSSRLISCFAAIRQCCNSDNWTHKWNVLRTFKKLVSAKAYEFKGDKQNDAHEFLVCVLQQMRSLFPILRGVAENMGRIYTCPVQTHLTFQMQSTRTCKGCGMRSINQEDFANLSLELVAGSSVSHCLQRYLTETQVEYRCECGAQTSGQMWSFRTLPSALILHLKRFISTPTWSVMSLHRAVTLSREPRMVDAPSGETANHEQNQDAVEPLNQEEPTRPPVCPPSATVTDRSQQTEQERDGSNALKKMTDEEKLEDEGGQIVPTLTEEQFECLGLPNFAQTCYMNSGLQSLLRLKTFNREIDLQRKVWSSVNSSRLISCFEAIRQCCNGDSWTHKWNVLSTFKKLVSDKAPEFRGDEQNDAHEFLVCVLQQMRSLFPILRGVAENMGRIYTCPVQTHLTFQMQSTRTCKGCGMRSINQEDFSNLSLDLVDGFSVSQCLQRYLTETQVEYRCECGAQTSGQKWSFQTLPSVLILHLKRFTFTPTWSVMKLHREVTLSRELRLVTGPSEEIANHEQNQDAARLLNQEEPTHPPVCPPSATVTESGQQTEEEKGCSNALQTCQYKLVSVISHIGFSTYSGHYISEGVCPYGPADQGDRWLSYNDDFVSETTGASVFQQRKKTAYVLFYEKQSVLTQAAMQQTQREEKRKEGEEREESQREDNPYIWIGK